MLDDHGRCRIFTVLGTHGRGGKEQGRLDLCADCPPFRGRGPGKDQIL